MSSSPVKTVLLPKNQVSTFEPAKVITPVNPTLGETHLYVGENMDTLLSLQQQYAEKVDLIFIDPPYNTGKTFYTYTDRTKNRNAAHTEWLKMMKPRLQLALPFLRETGVIIVAIGSKEQPYLKILLDELMGEENFISMLTMAGMLKNNASFVSTSNEYWLIYGKNVELLKSLNIKWRAPKKSAQFILDKAAEIWDKTGDPEVAENKLRKYYTSATAKKIFEEEPGLKMYYRFDSNGRLYRTGDLSSPDNKGGSYPVINPHTGQKVAQPVRGWVHNENTFKRMIEENRIEWRDNKTPYYKRYLDESTRVVKSDICYPNRLAPSKLLVHMIGRNKFTFPKDHELIAEWVDYVIPETRKRDIENPPVVMDFFAGSGSTAHAVAELNQKLGTQIMCILATNNENNIPKKVTIPRLKAMVTGEWADKETHEPLPGIVRIFNVKRKMLVNFETPPFPNITKTEYVNYIHKTVKDIKTLK